jgi:hypothetical protein
MWWWLAAGCIVAAMCFRDGWHPLLCVAAVPLWPVALALYVIMKDS